jgi:hypothetical protein
LTGEYANAADRPDLSQIDRRIAKEPACKATQPLYGLYVFGPQAKTRVWAIFNKSKPDAPDYDLLCFDRNTDGDLTAPEERIVGKVEAGGVTFDIGSFTDPVTKQKHTAMSITRQGGSAPLVTSRMKWCDKVMIRGGYAPDVSPYTQFATTPAKAPVLWPGADGPLSFQFWQLKPLNVGEAEDVRVFLGHQGHGRNTFCAVTIRSCRKKCRSAPPSSTRIKRASSDVPSRNCESVAEASSAMAPCGSLRMRLRARRSFALNYPRIADTFR